MTVYVFDRDKKIREILSADQVIEIIHDESNYSIHAEIDGNIALEPGEHIGFRCVDDRFRIFTVDSAAHDDDHNVMDVTATDAIVSELQEIILEEKQQLDVQLHDAIRELLPAEWTITGTQPDNSEKTRAYYTSAWQMLRTFEQLYSWRIIVYYTFASGQISGKVIETMPDEGVFRGRILNSRKDAGKVYVTKKGKPITRLIGLGPAQGSRDVQTNMTFAKEEWYADRGDPVDKPAGQTWVEDPEAVAKYGLHTSTVSITDAKDEADLLKKTWAELQRLKEPAVTAEAVVADVEMIPGHEHQMIRLGDKIAIRLTNGTWTAARVIAIKRYYVKKWLTKITIGDQKSSISYQVASLIASATHTFERLTIYQNRFHEDEALIQLNAEFIQANARAIEANAEEIRLNASELFVINSKVVEIDAEITAVKNLVANSITTETLSAEIAALEYLSVGGDVNVPGSITCDTMWVNGETHFESTAYMEDIEAYGIECSTLKINGDQLEKASLTVVTGIDVVKNLEGHITAVQPVTTQFYYFT